jgi:hypothetical protein
VRPFQPNPSQIKPDPEHHFVGISKVVAIGNDTITSLPLTSFCHFVSIMPHAHLPLTGFSLFADGSLLLKGGNPNQWIICQPDQLSPDAFKQFLWLLEDALGGFHNDLAQTDPASIRSLLRVIVLCLATQPRDPQSGAVLTWRLHSNPTLSADESSGRRLLKPVARLLSAAPIPTGIHHPGVERLGGVPEAAGLAVA